MKERDLNWIEKMNIWAGALFLGGSLYWKSWRLSLSILIGFLIVVVNFWFLKKIIFSAFQKQSSKFKLAITLGLKYVVLFVSVGFSIIYFDLHMVGLLIGISTLVISIIGFAVKQAFLF